MKINLKFLANPYYLFALIWTVALLTYLLQWSNMFPPLSQLLLIFLLLGIFFHYLVGIKFSKITLNAYRPINYAPLKLMFILNSLMWVVEFAYSRVPLLEILSNNDYDYFNFGVPTLVVVNFTFNSFLCLYSLHVYLSTRNRSYLKYIFFCLGYFVLCFSRGLIVITLANMLFLYLLSLNRNISIIKIIIFISFLFIFLFGFGYSGNIRTNNQLSTNSKGHASIENPSDEIMRLGSATAEFRKSIIPKEYFWTYIYLSSPISNLQYNINTGEEDDPSMKSFFRLVINEYVFDVLSKRINETFDISRPKTKVIVDYFSVYTTFSESYTAMGWFGLILTLLFMLVFPLVYVSLLGINSQYLPLALSMICSIYLLSFFDNMFVFAGLGLQLVYPILLEYKIKF